MMDVRDSAIKYLNVKPRTRKQIITHLKNKGFNDDEILDTVKELEEYRYIDDEEFCRMYFQYGFEKGRGLERIKRELAEKGVAADIIQTVFEELEEVPDQLEAALAAGQQVIRGIDVESLDYDSRRKLQAKIGRRLVSRGFSTEIAYKVMNRLV
ncbi:MAG: RecX family transcriptional regulator [Bacillota bacterium]|nr:RecX family transcriptional regulator [Bacillota bacterium]